MEPVLTSSALEDPRPGADACRAVDHRTLQHRVPARELRRRLLKAIEQKVAGEEIERVEVEARPLTTDLVATLKASLRRKALAKASPTKSEEEPASVKRPARRRRAS